jgi:hypothetical protein
LVWPKRVKNRDIKFTNGSLFLLLLGGFTMQSPLITAYVFKGKKDIL